MGNKSGKSRKKDSTILTEEEIQFLLRHTNYTREQINKWHRGFLVGFNKHAFLLRNFILNEKFLIKG
jgi:hypothetical protein